MDLSTGLKRGPFSELQTNKLIEVLPGLSSGQVQWLNGYLTGLETLWQDLDTPEVQAQPAQGNSLVSPSGPIWILYATHTGNCENLAKESAKKMAEIGREAKVLDMESFKVKELKKMKELLVIVSTDGEGDPPLQAEELLEYLRSSKAPDLSQVRYSVLALGDSSYAEFCQTGKDFDAILEKLGAQKITGRVDCDVDFDDDYERWIAEVLSNTGLSIGNNGALVDTPGRNKQQTASATAYSRKHPFPATVLKKIKLNGRYSSKETFHLELDLAGSQLRYKPGDALGIYALNSDKLVDSVLEHLHFSGEETVESHQGVKSLKEALISDYELTPLTPVSLKAYAELTGSKKLKKALEDKQAVSEYIYGRDILDLIGEEPCAFTPQTFLSLLRKNMPRMYSIASSQEVVEDEVHVLVSTVRYEAYGRQKTGHCSSFLADRIQEEDQVRVFIDPNTRFKLPEENQRPIIMVGPGTGIAPYRAFMQEREAQENAGKSWLFFGDRNFTTDFLYQTEWLQYLKEGTLTRANVAFSRDQEEKIYVQHKMLEQGKDLFSWLEEGAHFYVCGEKQHMAKDVDNVLKMIIQQYGGKTEEKAIEYVKQLQREGRYQTDVY